MYTLDIQCVFLVITSIRKNLKIFCVLGCIRPLKNLVFIMHEAPCYATHQHSTRHISIKFSTYDMSLKEKRKSGEYSFFLA